MTDRYAAIQDGRVVGVVLHDGVSENPRYPDLRGPVPEGATLEQLMGKKVEGRGPFVFAQDGSLYTPKVLIPDLHRTVLIPDLHRHDGWVEVDLVEPEGPPELKWVEPRAFLGEGEAIPPERTEEEEAAIIEAMGGVESLREQLAAADAEEAMGFSPPAMTASQLIEAADSMKFFALKAEAKRILGDDCPNSKAAIIAVLGKVKKVSGDGW